MVDITSSIIGVESSGNPFARNPRSSAAGLGGFIDSTWLEMVKKRRPDIASGRSDAEILQMKFDPNLSREMTQAYADQNTEFLRSRGIEATPGNTYLAHFAGPGGAAAIHANPGATVEALLGPRAVAANPFLRGKTGRDVIDWANRKMTPAQHMAKTLRQRYGSETGEGAAPAAAPSEAGMERLKAALGGKSYDPDKLSDAEKLIGRGQDIASTSGNWIGALGGTILSGVGSYQRGQEGEQQKAYSQELRQGLSGATDPMAAARLLMASPDPKMQAAGIEMFSKLSAAAQSAAGRTPSGYRLTADGNLEFIPGGPADPALKPRGRDKYTEGQSKSANFANMMTEAERTLSDLAPKDAQGKPGSLKNPLGVLGYIREGVVPEGIANTMRSEEYQKYLQGAQQWVRAKLRRESGATITDSEFEGEFKTYFPQPGDTEAVVKQKAKAREEAIKGMRAESGGAYEQMFPQQPEAAPTSPPPAGPPPAPALQYLRSNPTPEIIDQFNAKYGRGAAERFLMQAQPAPEPEPSQFGVSP